MGESVRRKQEELRALRKPAKPALYIISPQELLAQDVHGHAGWRIGSILDYLEEKKGVTFAGEEEMDLIRSDPAYALKKKYIDKGEHTRLLFPGAEDYGRIPTLKLVRYDKPVLMPGSPLPREYNWNGDGRLLAKGKKTRI